MKPEIGQIYEGKITSITNFGAFVSLPEGPDGMVHISEVSDSFVKDIHDVCKVGDVVKVKVISIAENGKIALSIKKANETNREKMSRPQGQRRMQKPQGNNTQKPATKSQSKPVLYPDGVWEETVSNDQNFEDMMSKFKKSSQDRMSDLKRGGGRDHGRRTGHSSGNK